MNIAFLLWSPDISGGSYVIFEHSIRLQAAGHRITIITEARVDPERLAWHPEARGLEWTTYAECPDRRFDLLLATWWKTVFELHRIQAESYGYFVQSIESRFYPESEKALRMLVDGTYHLPLSLITEADWIQKDLYSRTWQSAYLARNGIRKDLYQPNGPRVGKSSPETLRILVEGPMGVAFKNVERTLALCLKSEADEVWLLTSSDIDAYPGVHRVYSRIPIHQTPEVYRSCDVLVKLSYVEGMFGPPLEMFHCGGTAVTYNVTGHEMYLEDGVNSFVAAMGDEATVLQRINTLKRDPDLLRKLKEGATKTAEKWPGWEAASQVFGQQLELMAGHRTERQRERLKVQSEHLFNFYVVAEQAKGPLRKTYFKDILRKIWRRLRRVR